MKLQTKQLKYRFKALTAGFAPRLHWAFREALFGLLEPELGLLPQLCRPEALFIDVGANWGAYCHHARRWSKGVVAFEPQPRLARVLQQALRKRVECRVWQAAVSDVAGRVQLRIPLNDIGYSTVEAGNLLKGTADLRLGVQVVDVRCVRLDDMALDTVSCIKIDVEGHELSVLAGARELIARDRPYLIVETEDRHCRGTRQAVVQRLHEWGYAPWVFRDGELRPGGAGDAERNLVFAHACKRMDTRAEHNC